MARQRKRKKQSGIVYFAVNHRIKDMVKIGKTVESADKRLEYANKTNPFMCGRWSITQKVKTNGVDRTEELAHQLFADFHDKESVSKEMFFIPEGMTVKNMADLVRKKDVVYKKIKEEESQLQEELLKKKKKLAKVTEANKKEIFDISKNN